MTFNLIPFDSHVKRGFPSWFNLSYQEEKFWNCTVCNTSLHLESTRCGFPVWLYFERNAFSGHFIESMTHFNSSSSAPSHNKHNKPARIKTFIRPFSVPFFAIVAALFAGWSVYTTSTMKLVSLLGACLFSLIEFTWHTLSTELPDGTVKFTPFVCDVMCCDVLCCAVMCCAVMCCDVMCCAVLCCAVLCCAVMWCVVATPNWIFCELQ